MPSLRSLRGWSTPVAASRHADGGAQTNVWRLAHFVVGQPREVLRCMDGLAAKLLREQLGLITLKQALAAGMSEGAVRHRVESGRWQRVTKGVYLTSNGAMTPGQRVLSATIKVGEHCAASGRTAAWLWHLDGYSRPPRPLEITTPYGVRVKVDGVRSTQMRGFEAESIVRVDKVPACSVSLTLIQLAAVEDEETLEIALDSALRDRSWLKPQLEHDLARLGHCGRPGSGTLARLLQMRGGARDSALEVKVERLCIKAGIPPLAVQYRIVEEGKYIVRADFALPKLKIAILAQGYRFHAGHKPFVNDSRQFSELNSYGWIVLTPTWHEIVNEPDAFVGRLRRAIATASARSVTR